MELKMVLNELSLQSSAGQPPAENIETAKQQMSDLISTIQAATELGVKRVLYTPDDFYYVLLAPGYPVAKWLGNLDRENQTSFKSMITRSSFPYRNERQYIYGQWKDVIGFGYAHSDNALAISINSKAWPDGHLQLELLNLDDLEHDQDDLETQLVGVIHASCREHVQNHARWIKRQLQENKYALASDEISLWNHKEKLFPNLLFCSAVRRQLLKNLPGSSMLERVIEMLSKLDQYCEDCSTGPFNRDNVPCGATPESKATRQKYGKERMFECPDGETRFFDLHAKFGAWRIHFFESWFDPSDDRRRLIIGYIGPHLPTVSEST
jgi:hypothetical protein